MKVECFSFSFCVCVCVCSWYLGCFVLLLSQLCRLLIASLSVYHISHLVITPPLCLITLQINSDLNLRINWTETSDLRLWYERWNTSDNCKYNHFSMWVSLLLCKLWMFNSQFTIKSIDNKYSNNVFCAHPLTKQYGFHIKRQTRGRRADCHILFVAHLHLKPC